MTEPELVLLLKQGDDRGYDYLCSHYSHLMYGIICRIVFDEAHTQNLLQDCFVKVWRNFPSYDPAKGTLATWLINIARNTAIDFTRSKYYAQQIKNQNLDHLVHTFDNLVDRSPELDALGLKQLVTLLSPEQKEVIEYMYFKGFTQQEISDELGIPLGTIKTRTRSALSTLRTFFDVK